MKYDHLARLEMNFCWCSFSFSSHFINKIEKIIINLQHLKADHNEQDLHSSYCFATHIILYTM